MVSNPFGDPLTVAVESDVSGLESGIAGAISQLGTLKAAVGGVGVALAGLAAGGLAKSVSAAADFEQQMVELEKVTDPTTAREMGTAIQDMATRMPLAQSELAGIAEQAGRLGITGTENIRNFTRVTGEMATATDLTAEEAADSFARMSTLMNEPIENVRAIGDATNALSNSMATSSSEITDSATRSAGALTNMGMSSSDILALNAAMNEVSPSARVAGTQLRRMAQEMMNPKKVDNIAGALGMTTEEFKSMRDEDPTDVIRLMAEEMGKGGQSADNLRKVLSTTSRQALAGLSNNLDSMNTGLDTSQKQFDEGGSLAKEFEAAMGTFKNTVQITRNNLRNLAISTGQLLLPALTQVMRAVNSLISRFSSFNESTGGVAGVVTLLTTLFGGLIMAGGALVSALGGMSAVLAPVMAGFSALGTVIGAILTPISTVVSIFGTLAAVINPVTILIGGLIAVVVALGAAWASDWAGIRSQTVRVANAIQKGLQPIIGKLNLLKNRILKDFAAQWGRTSGGVEAAVARIVSAVGDQLVAAISIAVGIITTLLDKAYLWWAEHGETVVSIVIRIVNIINNTLVSGIQTGFVVVKRVLTVATQAFALLAQGVRQAITIVWQNVLQPFISWFVPVWRETMGPVVEEAAKTWSVWSQIVTYTINTIRKNINAFLTWLTPYWNAYWKEFNAQFKVFMADMRAIWDLVGADVIATARFVWDLVKSIIRGSLTVISGILQTFAALLRADWSTAWNIISQTVYDALFGIGAFTLKWGERFLGRIGEILLGVINWFVRLGQRLIWGSLIPDMLTAINNAFVNYLTSVLNFVKQTFNNILTFITTQFTATKNFLLTALTNIAQFFRTQFTLVRNLVSDIWAALNSDTQSVWGAIRKFLVGTLANIEGTFSRQFNAIRNFVSRTLSNIYQAVRNQMSSTRQFLASTLGAMVRRVRTWASNAYSAFWDGLDRMYRALGRAGNQLKSRMSSIANAVVQRVKNVGGKMYNAGKGLIQSIVRGINNSPNAVKNAVASHVGKAAKFLPWSDAEEGPLSNLSESGPGLVRTIAQGIRAEGGRMSAAVRDMAAGARAFLPSSDADTGPLSDLQAAGRSFGTMFAQGIRSSESEVVAAAQSVAGAARGALGGPTLNTGSGGGQQHPTLQDIINRDEELTPGGAREALSYLEDSELNQLAKAIGQTNWADGFSDARGLIQDFQAGGFSQDLFNALYLSEDANRGRAGVATTFAKILNDEEGQSPPQNQTPNISAQFDSLAKSNRKAIQRLEGEMAQRLDTLITHAKDSEGVVRIDGKRAGTIIEGSMHRKQYSTEIRE